MSAARFSRWAEIEVNARVEIRRRSGWFAGTVTSHTRTRGGHVVLVSMDGPQGTEAVSILEYLRPEAPRG